MKTLILTPIGVSVAVIALCVVGFVGCGGCAAGKGQYDPTTKIYDTNALADVVVVTAENTRASALNVFHALMTFEKNHDAALRTLNPGIHTFTEKVRRESKGWLDDLSAARTAYQTARTPENASKLRSTWAMVDSMLSSAAKHLAEASAVTVKAP